jgi:hypothetical protein
MTRAECLEVLLLTALAAAGGAVLTWFGGPWGWTWDALNHHVYLGLIAESPRWSLDVLAASYQGYQHPYLYWPVYRIALMSGDGQWVAMAWTAAQAALVLPPIWFCARALLAAPQVGRWEMIGMRVAACFLAALNGVVLLGLQPSSNDLMAAWPLLCGTALHLSRPASIRFAGLAAMLWGASVALKWSNGLMLPVLLFWAWHPVRPHLQLRRCWTVACGAVIGFAVVWAPWGLQLWSVTGNPFYPYFRAWFGGYGA